MKFSRGLTLIEVITCAGILIVLCAVLAPAAMTAKMKAKVTRATMAMRQIGQARSLYFEDREFYQSVPMKDLVDSGLLDKEVCGQGYEVEHRGLANLFYEQILGFEYLLTPYRNSFITQEGYGFEQPELLMNPSASWAINYQCRILDGRCWSFPLPDDFILRLRFDGSVHYSRAPYGTKVQGMITADDLFR